jgi:hypothetical protein
MSTEGGLGAVVFLRTTRAGADMARALGAMEGVSRVERVRGPYDFVIHAAGPAQVVIIERFPGVSAAEVCWLSSRSEGGTG